MPFDEAPKDEEEPDPLLFKPTEGLALSKIGVNLARTSSGTESGTRSSGLPPRAPRSIMLFTPTLSGSDDAGRDHSHHASWAEAARKRATLVQSSGGGIVPVVRKMVTFS
jgi:hypothetical protein